MVGKGKKPWMTETTQERGNPTQNSRQTTLEQRKGRAQTHEQGKHEISIAVDNATYMVLLPKAMCQINIPNTQGHKTYEQG